MTIENLTEILERHGWSFECWTRCGEGHTEAVFINPNRPGELIHEDCCGNISLRKGRIVEELVKRPVFELD